jgi:hypothetical protein
LDILSASIGFNQDLFCHPSPHGQTGGIDSDDKLSVSVIGNDFNVIAPSKSQSGQPKLCTSPAHELLNDTSFAFLGTRQGHEWSPFFVAVGTQSIDFHLVLKNMKAVAGSDFHLHIFYLLIFKLNNLVASGTDEMVVVKTQVAVFV